MSNVIDEKYQKQLAELDKAIIAAETRVAARNTLEAKAFLEGFTNDREAVRRSYVTIDTADHSAAVAALNKLQSKEEYLTELIGGYEIPSQEKKSLVEEKTILLEKIEARKEITHER